MTIDEILLAFRDGGVSAGELRREVLRYQREATLSPLSQGQDGLWLLQRLSPDGTGYNVPLCFALTGDLDVARWRGACEFLPYQHPALATVTIDVDGEGRQQVDRERTLRFEYADASDWSEGELRERVRQRAKEPFDLAATLPLRVHLFARSASEHVVLVVAHHIAFDGTSVPLLLRTLFDAYDRLTRGERLVTAAQSSAYREFVDWEREMLDGSLGVEHRDYWLRRLAPPLPVLELPTSAPRSVSAAIDGRRLVRDLPPELGRRVVELARERRVTPAVVLLAVYDVLLHRYTGESDLIVGMPIGGRPQERFDGVIGYFVNMIALRTGMDRDSSFAALLEDLRLTVADGLDHAHYPFPRVVRDLGVSRLQSRTPVFQVAFEYLNASVVDLGSLRDLDPGGLRVAPYDAVRQEGEYELALEVHERPGGFQLHLKYDAGLFDEAAVSRMTDHYTALLDAALTEPDARWAAYPVLPAAERALVVEGFNATRVEYPTGGLVHELFEQRAATAPDAVALSFDGTETSYRELNERANRLAHFLRERGVGPDVLVALCVERGVDMVVGLLGVLKAGGAYLPLDPGYPADRLAFMLHDGAPSVVLTTADLREKIAETTADVVELDTDWPLIAEHPTTDPQAADTGLTDRHLAYVIYTSGSTGRPKGTAMPHRPLVNLLRWHLDEERWPSPRRTLQFAALGFDVAFQETFATLTAGGELVLVDEDTRRDPAALTAFLAEHRVERLFMPYVALQSLVDHAVASGADLPDLRDVITAGEQLRITAAMREFFERRPDCRLHNHYGPTESHVVTAHTLPPHPGDWPALPPIGRPIANSAILLLDPEGEPVPVGVPGEIHIGGAGVARGYLGRPELTEERFVPDPFRDDPEARLYRTGDLGRWNPDGSIDYLGRNDDQVKIRGLRVELGEIEAVLSAHPRVAEAAVTVREDRPGDKRLVAYVVGADRDQDGQGTGTEGADEAGVEELRRHLAATLPEHMVPAAFVTLAALPVSPNGKLDRKALPAPGLEAYSTRRYEAPSGELEQTLAEVWQELLHVERVGRLDNFFELGGHSLLVVQMIARLQKAGVHSQVSDVFWAPTLAALAQTLAGSTAEAFSAPPNLIPDDCTELTPELLTLVELDAEQLARIVASVPGGAANVQDVYPLGPLQEGILFHHLLNPEQDTYVLPMLLRLDSRDRLDALVAALRAVIARHDSLRSSVRWEELPRPVQVVHRQAPPELEEITVEPGREALDAFRELMAPERLRMDLRRAPLIRLRTAPETGTGTGTETGTGTGHWYLLLELHHLATDHVALEIMLAEVMAHLADRTEQLPEPIAYREFVAKAVAQGQAEDAEEFFRARLADVEEPTTPFGLSDVHGDGSGIAEAKQFIDPGLAERVRLAARGLGVSPATLFHAAWALVVARTSGRDDVVFGTVLSGRLQGTAGADRVLGMFINTLPMRLRLAGTDTRALVERTHREIVDLLDYEHVSPAVAQRASGVPGGGPLYSAMLNYRHSSLDPRASSQGGSDRYGVHFLAIQERTNYPFAVFVDDLGEDFMLTAQTDEQTVAPHRVIGFLDTALASLVTALETGSTEPALTLAVLPAAERALVVEGFNATRVDYPAGGLVHELFEQRAATAPDAVALSFEGSEVSYGELNERANRLAHFLRERGVGPDVLVALCVERGVEMVVGLLGVLKAGGAYLPLDPGYPADRLAFMLHDGAPSVVLTTADLREKITDTTADVVELDTDWPLIAEHPADNPQAADTGLTDRHLAYVIYTSGSTGRPKGAMNEHRAVVNRLRWMQDAYGLTDADRVLQKTPFSFDVSVWEFFWPLLAGARLVVARPQGHQDPAYLAEEIRRSGVTVLHFVPSMLDVFLDAGAERGCDTLRHIVCSGEELSAALRDRCLERLPRAALHNLYGPTEAAIDVTHWTCRPGADPGRTPIGRPIANLRVHLLDERMQPVPLGVPGEIHIGGVGVARGYLGRPELTEERFVPDPFADDPQARLYRTGDLGRWNADGAVEYLGRNDHQVKIRGLRIELPEIEAQLREAPGVREAVVLAREDVPGDKRLVAYLTCLAGEPPTAQELRDHLATTLPEYMVPSAFVVLDALPLTPNGKLDRKALPAPDLGALSTREYEAPLPGTEEVVAGIWHELLRVERVGRHDDFFGLGGHSLMIVQLVERLRRHGIATEVRTVFDHPTPASLAAALDTTTAPLTARTEIPPNLIPDDCTGITPQMLTLVDLDAAQIERIERAVPGGAANIQDVYPLMPLQEGLLFHHRLNDGADAYILASLTVLDSRARLDAFLGALQSVIDRHDSLRTAVLWQGLPQPVQVVHRGAPLPVEEIALDPGQDPVAQLEALMGAGRMHMDIGTAPLIRAQVAPDPDPASGRWYALLQIHHLVDDVTSQRILHEEVLAHLRGQAHLLPEPVAYRSFVAHALAQAERPDAVEYFTERLADLTETTAPYGVTDVHGDGSAIIEARRTVGGPLARRLREHAGRLGVSVASLFHAAWGLLVARSSGRDDIAFGTVLLGRLQDVEGADRALGMFVNTLPIRLRLAGLGAEELVRLTHREVVELLRYEQVPLVLAQRCSGVTAPAPLFTAILNYRHSRADQQAAVGATRSTDGVDALSRQERTNYPFTLCVDDLGDAFELTALTDRRIDPAQVADGLHTVLESLADALASAPGTEALALEVISAAERHRQLEAFNPEPTDYPRERLFHELFEEQADRRPDALALVHGERTLTYAELDTEANRLAHHLRDQGVGPRQVVALALPRGPELITALLAVLKAGAAYLPVDLTYPADRVRYMLQDARPAATLTTGDHAGQLPEECGTVVRVDEPGLLAGAPTGRPPRTAGPDSLAYVIYTSGSTGRPKGTLLSHHGVSNVAEAQRRVLGLEDAPKVIQLASISFDAAVFEIVMAWRGGGSLHLGSADDLLPGRPLAEVLTQQGITAMTLTPSALAALPEGDYPRLRTICVAGETCPAELVARWAPGRSFFNLYGPTETTIWATAHRCEDTGERPPIGAPVPNKRVYVLDAHQRPVPTGVAGELYVGGVGVALGYHGRPELTAERFLPDPFRAGEPEARVYRTGDRVRWRASGSPRPEVGGGVLEFLGRADDQVKIRGFRVELGEIEARLSAEPTVAEAVVVAREESPGDLRLVGYVVPEAGTSRPGAGEDVRAFTDALRAALEAALPGYMVPGRILVLDAMPVTPNGKLDRKALPAPDPAGHSGEPGEAPAGAAEELVAAAFTEVLDVEPIGRYDDFFDLGGHSLLASRLAARLEDVFEVKVPLKDLFSAAHVAGVAEILADLHGGREALEEAAGIYTSVSGLTDDEVRALLENDEERA
ncbi:amino acid adenylation domain-containing protein [Kitasatospora sp. NBC_01287]|uniref:non-ribosomal peptide synthetase n=1 Tax=Kitasatospora sp. NBC_01287 TaxID=2903573 RepID=UPI00225BE7A1|nr:non-ribosomal peptide synthetase [Kitasatospora sp. NBC_01287]MCX4743981.1 amino acid adenylation domain-containing protein [Kitasatospora sp. NBC_01287]